jgi:hypothetical protein
LVTFVAHARRDRRPQRPGYDFSFGNETVLPNDGKATFKRNVDRLFSFAQDV